MMTCDKRSCDFAHTFLKTLHCNGSDSDTSSNQRLTPSCLVISLSLSASTNQGPIQSNPKSVATSLPSSSMPSANQDLKPSASFARSTTSSSCSRSVGWQLMKSLLWQAGSDQPGLFISERCQSLWATLPYCISEDKNPDDMTKNAPDHSADAVRYVLTAANQGHHKWRSP